MTSSLFWGLCLQHHTVHEPTFVFTWGNQVIKYKITTVLKKQTINNNCPVLTCPNDSGWNDAIDDNYGSEAKDDDDEDENDGRDGFADDGEVSSP